MTGGQGTLPEPPNPSGTLPSPLCLSRSRAAGRQPQDANGRSDASGLPGGFGMGPRSGTRG